MKKLWRVSNHCDLSGLGGERADGRWHTAARGKRIVYLSEHPALALIENLANLKGNPSLLPDQYQLMELEADEEVIGRAALAIDDAGRRPSLTTPLSSTQNEGDTWLREGKSAFLVVPSFPSPFSLNYLFNPLHPDASRLKILHCRWLKYDRRLFRIPE